MNKRFRKIVCACAILLQAVGALAQTDATISFQTYFALLPKPLPSMKETFARNDMNAFEKAFGRAKSEAERGLAFAYEPILAKLHQNAAEAASNKAVLTRYSAEERAIMESSARGSRGLGTDAKSTYLHSVLEKRPLLASGKLSWAAQLQKLSASEAGLYQQLLSLEKSFGWSAFNEQAQKSYYAFGDQDAAMKAVDEQFNAEFSKLPRIKIKLFEGAYTDMEDPSKAIELYEKYLGKKEKIFESRYAITYKHWQQQHDALNSLCDRLENLLATSTADGSKVLALSVADVKARIWQSLASLCYLTHRTMMDALTAGANRRHAEETIAAYVKYKESTQ